MAESDGRGSDPVKESNEKATKPCIVESGVQQKEFSNKYFSSKNDGQILNQQDDHQQQIKIRNEVCESDGKSLQIVVDRIRAVTIRTLLQGILTKAIVATGAEVTILSERLYNLFPKEKRPKLQKAKRGLIVAEAGKEMTTYGTFDTNFKLGEFEFNWPVYVAPIGDDILLGCDIIDQMDITVNTKRGIQVKDQWVESEITRSHDTVGPEKIARAVTAPALSEFIMTANCSVKPNDDRQTFRFEASEMANYCKIEKRSSAWYVTTYGKYNVNSRLL